VRLGLSAHWAWLAGGFVVAFALPFLLADVLEINRDLFYGLNATAVLGLIGFWARATAYDLVAAVKRRWQWAVALRAVFAGVMAFMVVRTEDATARPDGFETIGALLWRGVVYGVADGLLLSGVPDPRRLRRLGGRPAERSPRRQGRGRCCCAACLTRDDGRLPRRLQRLPLRQGGKTAYRGRAVERPDPRDAQPGRRPIAHAGLHVSAVLHSYDTDTFLPPHR
jgi:hypothetical protein